MDNGDNGEFLSRRDVNRKRLKVIMLMIPMFCSFLIAILDIVIVFFIGKGDAVFSNEKTLEASFVSNGLAVISIAVAVWIGINIYNLIDRKDIDEIREEIKKDTENIRSEAAKVHEIQIKNKKELEKIKEELSGYQKVNNDLKNNVKMALVNQMYFLNDPSNDYFADIMSKEDLILEKNSDLLRIEIQLGNIYKMHNINLSGVEERKKCSEKGISLVHNYINKYENMTDKERNLISYREGDFWFYKGYCLQGKDRYEAFGIAMRKFIEVAETESFFNMSDIEMSNGEGLSANGSNNNMAVYFLNAIGECLSEQLDVLNRGTVIENGKETNDKLIQKKGNLAAACMKFSVEYAARIYSREGASVEREVYYRNYGALLEKKNDKIALENAFEMYIKAFGLDQSKAKTYHVIISNLMKQIKYIYNIPDKKINVKRKPSLLNLIAQNDNVNKCEILLKNMKMYLEIAEVLFPQNANFCAFEIYYNILDCIDNADLKRVQNIFINTEKFIKKIEILTIRNRNALCCVALEEIKDLKEDYDEHSRNEF